MAENPEVGHARSAPVRTWLKRKIIVTSLLTIIPTAALYFIINNATAKEPDIYSTSSHPGSVYKTKNAGKGCKPATLENDNAEVPVNLNVPISPYFDASSQGSNPPSSTVVATEGAVGIGEGQLNKDGSLTLNGKKLGGNSLDDCPPQEEPAKPANAKAK